MPDAHEPLEMQPFGMRVEFLRTGDETGGGPFALPSCVKFSASLRLN